MVANTPADVEAQFLIWVRNKSRLAASLSIDGAPDAGAFIEGVLLFAPNGQRGVIGESGGFVLVPSAADAEYIETDDEGETTLVLRFATWSLRISDADALVEPDA